MISLIEYEVDGFYKLNTTREVTYDFGISIPLGIYVHPGMSLSLFAAPMQNHIRHCSIIKKIPRESKPMYANCGNLSRSSIPAPLMFHRFY